MQTFTSDYGRRGCHVPDRCPTRMIRHHLGNVHVATPVSTVVLEVEEEIRRQIAKRGSEAAEWTTEMQRAAIRYTIWQHLENRAEYAVVMGASL